MKKYTFEYRNGQNDKRQFFAYFAPDLLTATEAFIDHAPLATIIDVDIAKVEMPFGVDACELAPSVV